MAALRYVVRVAHLEDIDDMMRLVVELGEHEKVPKTTMTKEILHEDAFGERPSLKFFLGECLPSHSSNAEEEGRSHRGEIVGFASTNKMHDICYGRSAYLNGLFVEEKHRGNGLGTALMKAVVKDCVTGGCVNLNWDVLGRNLRTRRFYSEMGVTNMTETAQWEYWKFKTPDMKKFVADMTVKKRANVEINIKTLL